MLSNLIGFFLLSLSWPILIVIFSRTTRAGVPILEVSPWFLANALLLNFNPYTALSEPGQDLAANTLALIHGRGQESHNLLQPVDDFYMDDIPGQNDADKKVCCQSHPYSM